MNTSPQFCKGCGALLTPDNRFCEFCGQPISQLEHLSVVKEAPSRLKLPADALHNISKHSPGWLLGGAVLILILFLIGIFVLWPSMNGDTMKKATIIGGIPDNYYFSLKSADINSPKEVIRFASSIRPFTTYFTILERVSFFEWYLKNRGFDVKFDYSNNFDNLGKEHVWLTVMNKLGEKMYVEPSYIEMDASSICPIESKYKDYDREFNDIFELSRAAGGVAQYAWWSKKEGQDLWNKNIMLLKEGQLSDRS
jgi:hypothetical protein